MSWKESKVRVLTQQGGLQGLQVLSTESKKSSETVLEQSSQDDIESAFGGNIVQPKAITNAKVFIPKKQKRSSLPISGPQK